MNSNNIPTKQGLRHTVVKPNLINILIPTTFQQSKDSPIVWVGMTTKKTAGKYPSGSLFSCDLCVYVRSRFAQAGDFLPHFINF